MKHRLFTILSALSLLLCVAVVVLWVRSYWVGDFIGHGTNVITDGKADRISYRSAHSYRGLLRLSLSGVYALQWSITEVNPDLVGWQRMRLKSPQDGFLRQGTNFGFRLSSERSAAPGGGYQNEFRLTFPHWLPTLVLAVLPAGGVVGYFRKRRGRHSGLCASCGYDLRATPERCPECGAAPAKAGT